MTTLLSRPIKKSGDFTAQGAATNVPLWSWVAFLLLSGGALALCAVSLALSPFPIGDEGGYINMLTAFFHTGKMDLMQWSQPTFLGVAAFIAPVRLLGGAALYPWCGIAASFFTLAGLFVLTSRYTSGRNALLLSLSPLCHPDFVATIPTVMSDQFFLAYFVWALVGIDRFVERKSGSSLLLAVISFAFSVLVRANGYLLWIGASATNFRAKEPGARTIFAALSGASAVTILLSIAMTINRIPLARATSLPDVLIRHDFALFDIRAMFQAFFYVLFALTPALILSIDWAKLKKIDLAAALLGFVLSVHFCWKGAFTTPIAFIPILNICLVPVLASFSAAALTQVLRSAQNRSYSFRLCCFLALGTIAVMPIMPHPLARHALPAVLAFLIVLAVSGRQTNQRSVFVCAVCAGLLLISSNYTSLFKNRMENKYRWEAASSALAHGVPSRDLYVDWGWFCAHDLVPGQIENYDYQAVYKSSESSSKFFIKDGKLETRYEKQ